VAAPVVFWDFDGTLAQRPGLWSACVLEVLDETVPAHGISIERVRQGLADSFPWHRAHLAHPELADPSEWWRVVGAVIEQALTDAGFPATAARDAVPLVRRRYIDAGRGWEVYPDTLAALSTTTAAGWRNVVLSNHVPELADLIADLGLGAHLDGVRTSALTGYEKPHPEAYRGALRAWGNPDAAFMVGDSRVADVDGAEVVGLPAILVRRPGPAPRYADDLHGAAAIILAS
jgi:putative hydrolase of the HAD superfamily